MSRLIVLAAVVSFSVSLAVTAFGQNREADFVGIGLSFDRTSDGWMRVGGVLPDGPAQKAGIAAGDFVMAIDGADVRKMSNDDVMSKIRGQKDTVVALMVATPGQQQPREIKVTRAAIAGRSNPQPQPQPNQPADPAPANPAPKKNPLDIGGNPQPQPPLQQTGVQKFNLVELRDPGVGNIVAINVMAPAGWDVRGQVVWMPDFSIASNLELAIRDPKTGFSIQWLPTQSFTWMQNPPGQVINGGNYQGRIWMQPISDPAQFVGWFYEKALPHLRGAKITASERFPGLERFYGSQIQAQQKSVGSYRLRYEFAGPDQKPWEEDVYFTLAFSTNAMGGVMWEAMAAQSARGPKGSLDQNAAIVHAVINSTVFTPQWMASRNVVQQLFTAGIKQMQRDQQIFAQKLAEYREQIAQQSQQIAAERDRSASARAEAFREVLGGVENYRDPYKSQEVYLPAGYKEYWANAKGEYVLSDQWNYNPNVGDTQEWKKIERIDPMKR